MEDFGDYIFVVLEIIYYNKKDELGTEQVNLIISQNFVISFQEREEDVFNPIRERIRSSKGRIREMGPDYLAHALIDSVVDNYFVILEMVSEKLEGIEEELLTNPTPETLQAIHRLKRDMISLRKSVWPLREVIGGLERGNQNLFKSPHKYTSGMFTTIQSR